MALQARPLSCDSVARRRVWRMAGVRMGLLRHEGEEIESAVIEDDAVLVLSIRALQILVLQSVLHSATLLS
jgi:hypothetical protein